jgi:hypothetical protein
MVSGESLEDWIGDVSKCIKYLLKRNWKESDICIILTKGDLKDPIKYVRFYLMLKSMLKSR